MATGNPFTPTFGVTPPLLVGRDGEIDLFVEGLEDGPGSPYRALLVTGQRGSGKTVLLNALEDAARTRGWLVASSTTRAGVAHELAATILPALLSGFPEAHDAYLAGANLSAAGFGLGVAPAHVTLPGRTVAAARLDHARRQRRHPRWGSAHHPR